MTDRVSGKGLIVGVIGTPSPLTYIVTHMMRAAVQVSCGDYHMIAVNSISDLREAWPERGERKQAVVLASDLPHPDFLQFLLNAKVPLLLCVERVQDIHAYFIACRKFDELSALRIATQSLSALENVVAFPPATVRKFEVGDCRLEGAVRDLLEFAGCRNDHETVSGTSAFLWNSGDSQVSLAEFVSDMRRVLFAELGDEFQMSLSNAGLEDAARSYDAVVAGEPMETTFWPASCFLQANTPGLPVVAPLLLEGRARFLSHGPYFHLPLGLWLAEIEFEVSESPSQNRIGFDVVAGTVLAAGTAMLPEEGALACDMVFRVTDPTLPIEIRLQTVNGAIEGQIRLLGVRLRRLAYSHEE